MNEFEITKGDYIELDKLLKITGLVDTGGEAHMMILEGKVYVNDVVELQKRKKIRAGDTVKFGSEELVVK